MTVKGRTVLGTSNDTGDTGVFKNMCLMAEGLTGPSDYQTLLSVRGVPSDGVQTLASDIQYTIRPNPDIAVGDTLVFAWSGQGKASISRGSATLKWTSKNAAATVAETINTNSTTITVTGTDVYVEFVFVTSVPTSFNLNFKSGTYSNLGVPILCKLSDYTSVTTASSAEDYFASGFVAVQQTINPGILRPMGWTNPNSTNSAGFASEYRYMPPWNNSMGFKSIRWSPGAMCGATSSGDNAYVVAASPDIGSSSSPVDGELIHVKFSNALVGTNPTLQVGSRTAVPILQFNTRPLSAVTSITANSYWTLVYSRYLNSYVGRSGGQCPVIPYEFQIGLCNLIGADYWCNFHFFTDDASIDDIAALVRDNLTSGSTAFFEYANEIWNSQTNLISWAEAIGTAIGWSSSSNQHSHSWTALRTCQMMDRITAAWSPRTSSELKGILPIQAFGSASDIDSFRIQGTKLNSAGAANYTSFGLTDYSTAGNRPYEKATILSYATYFSGAQTANADVNYRIFFGGTTSASITAITQANPGQITLSSDPGWSTGNRVSFSSIAGMTELNSTSATLTKVDGTHYTIGVDTSGYSAYTSGGTASRYRQNSDLVAAAADYASGDATRMADALAWMDTDIRSGTSHGTQTSQILDGLNASGTGIYDIWNAKAVTYGMYVYCYEGGFESTFPLQTTCTTLGLSTAYGSTGLSTPLGQISDLIEAYKASTLFLRTCEKQKDDFMSRSRSVAWAWLHTSPWSQWSLTNGDYTGPRYKSLDAISLYNNRKRRFVVTT